ncbi:transposase [Streptomyces sp. NPDC050273]|uniref:transposase n=1 Tax=Streptomyces sp. NPDC050273 TaxID=3154933 RepID=UPI00341F97B3
MDLLPDREASSLAKWLARRPGIEAVYRDQAPFFAEGATLGAPQATQVADRRHLLHNLGEAAERALARHRQCLLVPEPAGDDNDAPAPPEETPVPPGRSHRFANRIRARHATATQCWKLATAAAGSAADSTWPIALSRDSPTPFSSMSSSGGSGRTTGPPPWTSTSPT